VRDGTSARAVPTGSQVATLVALTVAEIADLLIEVAFRLAAGSAGAAVVDIVVVVDAAVVDVAGSRIQGEMMKDRSRP
jgi:hypothetical protein